MSAYDRFEDGQPVADECQIDIDKSADDSGEHKLNTDALNQVPIENHHLRRVVEHLAFRLIALLLIVLDVIITIVAFLTDTPYLEDVSLALSFIFVVEVCLRMFAKGPSNFFQKWYNKVDICIVFLTFSFSVGGRLLESLPAFSKFVIIGRLVRIVSFVKFMRFYTEKKNLTKGVRHVISENKRRYQKDGFDLDLVYVTSRIIAMSYPSSGKMSWYRNPIHDVERFFRTKHPDHYMVCNMCSERTYDDSRFEGRILRLNIDDHNVPLLPDAINFVKKAQEFLDADPKNTIAIHCKGGKGRTGTLICMLLVHNNVFESAKESLQYFGEIRTDLTVGTKFQGVETPSQNRYVEYFEKIRNKFDMVIPTPRRMKATDITIRGINSFGSGDGSDLRCEVSENRLRSFDMDFGQYRNCRLVHYAETDCLKVSPINFPVVKGDIKFRFYSSSSAVPKGYENCAFFFWFNTAFVQDGVLKLHRDHLDNPHKKKTWTSFSDAFTVEVTLDEVE